MQLTKFLMVIVSMFSASEVVLADCTKEVDEVFEARRYRDWIPMDDGGDIAIGPGYKGEGVVISRTNPGGDQYTRLEMELPSTWVAKTIKVEAMVRYENIKPGNRFHHAGHIDYEAFTDTGPVYPDWGRFTGTQPDWQQWSGEWQIPANAERTVFRIGLQGTSGTIHFDDVKIYLCE